MDKAYTKEQLVGGIEVLDKYLVEAERFLNATKGIEIPEKDKKNYEALLIEYRASKNVRTLLANDLLINHGIVM